MPRKKPSGYTTAGVNLEPDVMAYLTQICEEEDRTRSYMVNKIIREHIKRTGFQAPIPGLLEERHGGQI